MSPAEYLTKPSNTYASLLRVFDSNDLGWGPRQGDVFSELPREFPCAVRAEDHGPRVSLSLFFLLTEHWNPAYPDRILTSGFSLSLSRVLPSSPAWSHSVMNLRETPGSISCSEAILPLNPRSLSGDFLSLSPSGALEQMDCLNKTFCYF